MLLRQTKKFTYGDGTPRKFYGCSNFPKCKLTHGAHPDGRPLGFPATQEVKDLRHELHLLAASVWDWNDRAQKAKMYQWIKKNSKVGHIAEMDLEELHIVRIKLLQLRGWL